jgi:hypothetical protein
MSVSQQRDILEHTFKQITEFAGKPPVGSVAPWWEVSKEGTEMLLDKGILYGECEPAPRRRSVMVVITSTPLCFETSPRCRVSLLSLPGNIWTWTLLGTITKSAIGTNWGSPAYVWPTE